MKYATLQQEQLTLQQPDSLKATPLPSHVHAHTHETQSLTACSVTLLIRYQAHTCRRASTPASHYYSSIPPTPTWQCPDPHTHLTHPPNIHPRIRQVKHAHQQAPTTGFPWHLKFPMPMRLQGARLYIHVSCTTHFPLAQPTLVMIPLASTIQ